MASFLNSVQRHDPRSDSLVPLADALTLIRLMGFLSNELIADKKNALGGKAITSFRDAHGISEFYVSGAPFATPISVSR